MDFAAIHALSRANSSAPAELPTPRSFKYQSEGDIEQTAQNALAFDRRRQETRAADAAARAETAATKKVATRRASIVNAASRAQFRPQAGAVRKGPKETKRVKVTPSARGLKNPPTAPASTPTPTVDLTSFDAAPASRPSMAITPQRSHLSPMQQHGTQRMSAEAFQTPATVTVNRPQPQSPVRTLPGFGRPARGVDIANTPRRSPNTAPARSGVYQGLGHEETDNLDLHAPTIQKLNGWGRPPRAY